MKSTLALSAFLLLAAMSGARTLPDSLSLEQFQTLAWPAAHRLAAAHADRSAAREGLDAARALRGPTLGLDLSGGWVSRTQELQMAGRTIEFGDGSSADAALQGAWTLYAGGALQAGEQAAEAELLARGSDLTADSLRLAEELRAVFFSALSAEAGLEASRLAATRLERHLADLQGRHAAGSVGEEAVLMTASRLEAARQDLALREGDCAVARLELGALCGTPGESAAPRGRLEVPLLGLDEEARRPADLAALDARLDLSRALVRQRRGAGKPRVESWAGLHLARPGVDPVANDWMTYANLGLRLRWSLWDGGLTRHRVAEARLGETALERRRAEAERRAESAVARSRELVAAARAAWEAALRRGEAEERRGELVEARWRQGMATERDWLDAVDDRRLARQERALLAARLRLAESRLLLALGR